MAEIQPPEVRIAALQQKVASIIRPPAFTTEGGVKAKPSTKEFTASEMKAKLPLEADGEKTNVPDYIKTHLADILKPEDIKALRLDISQPLSVLEQQKIVQHLLQSSPQRLLEARNALPALQSDMYNLPEIVASLKVIGIEALQQQYAKDTQSDTTHNTYTPIDKTFGLGSRRKVYTEMERFADETTLAGDSMKTFGRTKEGTPRLHSTVEMDLRLAQSLFNAALPPEKVIEVTKLQLQIQETSDPSEKTKLAHDLTLLRQKLYKGILVGYKVQPEKGAIVVAPSEKAEIEELAKQIRTRMNTVERDGQKLNGMDIEKANTVALEETLTALNIPITAALLGQRLEEAKMAFHTGQKLQTVTADFFADPAFTTVPTETKKIAQQILENRIRTSRSIAGIDDYYEKQGGLKPENLTFFTYLPMGLKGTELLYRRTLSEEELKEGAPQPAPEIPDWLNPKIPILQLEQKEEVKEDETAMQTTGISDQESSLSNHPLSTYKKGGFREDVQQVLQRGEDWESVKKGEPIPRRKKRGTEEPRPPGREKQDKRRVPSPKEALWERQQATSPPASPPEVTEGMEIHHATVPWMKGVVVEKTEEEKNIPGHKVRDREGNTYFIAESDTQVTPPAIESEKAQEAFDKLLTVWERIDKDRQLVEKKGPYYEERTAAQKKRLERLLQEKLEAEVPEDEIIALRTEEEERIKQIIEQAQHRYAAATQRIGESSVKEDLEAELRRLDPQRAEKAFREDVHFTIQQGGSPTTTATGDQSTQQATTEPTAGAEQDKSVTQVATPVVAAASPFYPPEKTRTRETTDISVAEATARLEAVPAPPPNIPILKNKPRPTNLNPLITPTLGLTDKQGRPIASKPSEVSYPQPASLEKPPVRVETTAAVSAPPPSSPESIQAATSISAEPAQQPAVAQTTTPPAKETIHEDPLIQEAMTNIEAAVARSLQEPLLPGRTEEEVTEAIRQRVWDVFVKEHPEQAAAYANQLPELQEALARAKMASSQQPPVVQKGGPLAVQEEEKPQSSSFYTKQGLPDEVLKRLAQEVVARTLEETARKMSPPKEENTVPSLAAPTQTTQELLLELNVPPFLLPRRWNILSREIRLAATQAIGLPDEVADSEWEQLSLVQQNAILEERAKIAGETKLEPVPLPPFLQDHAKEEEEPISAPTLLDRAREFERNQGREVSAIELQRTLGITYPEAVTLVRQLEDEIAAEPAAATNQILESTVATEDAEIGLTPEQAILLEEKLQKNYYNDPVFREAVQLDDDTLRLRFNNIMGAWERAVEKEQQASVNPVSEIKTQIAGIVQKLQLVYRGADDLQPIASMLYYIGHVPALPYDIDAYLPEPGRTTEFSNEERQTKRELLAIVRVIQILKDVTSTKQT